MADTDINSGANQTPQSPPNPAAYDPQNPVPYTPPPPITPPEITAPPPSALAQPSSDTRSPVFGGGKTGAIGSIAYIGDAILRGAMQGRERAHQLQLIKAKKLMDGFTYAKQQADAQILDMVQKPEVQAALKKRESKATLTEEENKILAPYDQAVNASNSSWQGLNQLQSQYLFGDQKKGGKGKGKKGNGQADAEDPVAMASSSDPATKLQGIFLIRQKLGNPVQYQVRDLLSKVEQASQDPKARLEHLITQHDDAIRKGDTATAAKIKSNIESLKEDLSPNRVEHPVYSRDLTPGKSLLGLKNPDGSTLTDALGNPIDTNMQYRKETVGDKTSWIPAAPKPTTTKPPSRDDRYIAILQAQQEGKPVSDEDKAYLQAYDLYVKRTKTDPGVARAVAFGANRYVQVLDPTNPEAVTFMRAGEAAKSGANTPAGIAFQTDKAITKAFTSGKPADNISYFNTAISHLKMLQDASDALHNGDMQLFNRVGNAFATATGQAAPTDFNAVRNAVAGELAKTFSGGRATESEIKLMNDTINSTQSPEQLASVVKYYTGLMNGKLEALKSQYESGKKAKPAFKDEQQPGGEGGGGGNKVLPKKGDKRTYQGHEYTFNGTQWER